MPEKSSARYVLAAAMMMAVGAGYWRGSMPMAGEKKEPERRLSDRGMMGTPRGNTRVRDAAREEKPAGEFIQDVMYVRVDPRQQWLRVRDFSEDEIKAAMEQLGDKGFKARHLEEFRGMLFFRWAQLDPRTAYEEAKVRSEDSRSVITAWIKKDLKGAWAFFKDDDHQPGSPASLSRMAASVLAYHDDATALREAKAMGDSVLPHVIDKLSERAKTTPESRSGFLASAVALKSEALTEKARWALIKSWAETDADGAREGVDTLGFTREEQEKAIEWIEDHGGNGNAFREGG